MNINIPTHLLFNFTLFTSALWVPAAIVYFFLDLPYRNEVLGSAALPAIFVTLRIWRASKFIDSKIETLTQSISDLVPSSKTLPIYRFVDLRRAIESYTRDRGTWKCMESSHPQLLSQILKQEFHSDEQREVNKSTKQPYPINRKEEEYLSDDTFWVGPMDLREENRFVIRLKRKEYETDCIIEVAHPVADKGSRVLQRILDLSIEHSVYRGQIIEARFGSELADQYGDVTRSTTVDVRFVTADPVEEEDIILDEETRRLLFRNVVDVHKHREQLSSLGLPSRRGVLLYGPPGTGKTHTCRYLATCLEGVTTIVASGDSLRGVSSLVTLASMLQPSLVVLEDVDLVFSTRETNFDGRALGEMLEALDGFSTGEGVVFILTTNAIDRVEMAIRDRPGRISQCIHYPAPHAELRSVYLSRLLKPYSAAQIDLDRWVAETEGSTQAFLKEFVFRAVQIAAENSELRDIHRLPLTDEHFAEALAEIRRSGGPSGDAITGFKAESSR